MIQAKHRNRLPLPQPAVVHVRRSYSECRYGQMHVWTSYPSGGGFDERTPVICLHHSGASGRLFAPMLREMGHDRSVYALDLPGHGTSDAPPARFSIGDLAGAVGDFLDSLRVRSADVFGYQLGALVAAELALSRPQQIRRMMLWGVPMHSAQERAALIARQPVQSMREGAREDGSDVAAEWQKLLEKRSADVSTAVLTEEFSDRLRAGVSAQRAVAAGLEYPVAERLPLVKQPTLVMRVKDDFWEHAPRVRAALPHGSLIELPEHGEGFISAAPQRFASVAREFLDR